MPQCALDCCRFFGTPCILYYTLYGLKETLRDQCTPTQKVMLLLFIINPLIQENTNNVVQGTSNDTLEGHSNRKNAQTDKKMAGRERGGEECPGIMRQSFVFARPITFGFAYMNPTLIG